MRRVVVTGVGRITPFGADVQTSWTNLIAGESGTGPVTKFDASDISRLPTLGSAIVPDSSKIH